MAYLGEVPGGSLWSNIGGQLGSGLSKGLSALAEAKLDQLERAQVERELEGGGYPREHARILSRYRNNPHFLDTLRQYVVPEEGEQQYQVDERNYLEQFQHPQGQEEFYNQPTRVPQQDRLEQIFQSLSNPMGLAQAQRGQVPQQLQLQQQRAPQPMQSQQMGQRQQLQQQQPRKIKPPLFKKPTTLEDQLKQERIQATINASNKPYTDSLEKRVAVLNDALPALQEMQELLQSGNVQSGAFAGNVPANLRGTLLNSDSDRFTGLGDDLATALTGLTTGVQTISKIKFNRERKPTLANSRETQIARTQDAANLFARVALESDLESYLIEKNGAQPRDLSSKVRIQYNNLVNNIPEKPQDAQEGQTFTDPETSARWKVQGPIMRFIGFKGEKNG